MGVSQGSLSTPLKCHQLKTAELAIGNKNSSHGPIGNNDSARENSQNFYVLRKKISIEIFFSQYALLIHPLILTSQKRSVTTRVGNFRQKNNSAEDGIDGTNGYFRRNSGCSEEQKTSEFRSESFRGRENSSEFRSVEQK